MAEEAFDLKPDRVENGDTRSLFSASDFGPKVGWTDLEFVVCDQGSLVGLCTLDHMSLCAAVMIGFNFHHS